MLDLSKLNVNKQSEEGYEFELLHPVTNEPVGAKITIRGEQSSTVRNYSKKKYNEYKLREQQAKRRGREVEELTLDEAEELAVESAVARIIGWSGITEDGKKELAFSPENAAIVLKEHSWIRDAIMEASQNLANFL